MLAKSFLKKFSLVLISLLSFTGCGGGSDDHTDQSVEAKEFVEEIVQIMRENAITRYEVDWMELENAVFSLADQANNILETRPAIQEALRRLNTNHSFVTHPNGLVVQYNELSCEQAITEQSLNDPNIGYIRIDGFGTTDQSERIDFAESIQQSIREQDDGSKIGWIVDLRFNTGGDMWPMITGIGPLLGNGTYGYFVDPDDVITSWGYLNGASVMDGQEIVSVNSPYVLNNPNPNIAVLSSKKIASSGEATLIAFKKLPNVRIFGSDTCGLSTANRGYPLTHGGRLVLTVSVMADRDLEAYGVPVQVDEQVPDSDVFQAAVDWLY